MDGELGAAKIAEIAAAQLATSVKVPDVHTTVALEISGVSAATVDGIGASSALVTPTVDCFVVQGAAPSALAPVVGTPGDLPLFGGNTYRLSGLIATNKLAFITAGETGTVYVTPGA
ncbi:MAG: hypothetical protein OEY01_10805 [Desulfobulbaceae bacterium]|nr:hypothetical protein [Desulfobulbaceae bacterium]